MFRQDLDVLRGSHMSDQDTLLASGMPHLFLIGPHQPLSHQNVRPYTYFLTKEHNTIDLSWRKQKSTCRQATA